jgi:hypothetical protein
MHSSVCLAVPAGPNAYYITIQVPTGTNRQQVDDGLKAAWSSQGLATDGTYRTRFCAVVTRVYRRDDKALLRREGRVFVESVCALSPDQALTWVKGAVPGSKLARRHHLHAITDVQEADYFRWRLEDQQGWAMYPGSTQWQSQDIEPFAADYPQEWEDVHGPLDGLWYVATAAQTYEDGEEVVDM